MSSTHPQLVRPASAGAFGPGYTAITRPGEPVADTGIELGIWRLAPGQGLAVAPDLEQERAYLLLDGEVRFTWDGGETVGRRRSLFEEEPVTLHVPARSPHALHALTEAEVAVFGVAPGPAPLAPRLFPAGGLLESEHRGRGLLDDAAYRIVRTIFDRRNRPEAVLVLGEVVNFPGRWSSYPPHHHPQPELYHYRFTAPQGYGHAELGDEVLKVRSGDTVKILGGQDHSQAAAPGYGMYYIWAIRHLPGEPYEAPRWPEFTAEHRWLLAPGAPIWRPRVPPQGDDR